MTVLVIDTATATCSVAMIDGDRIVAAVHEVVGRGHAERLVPMIAALPGGGRADRILVDCGPGSFTGIRVGIAAARGLALGWSVPVSGFGSMAILAAAAIARSPGPLVVILEGGHGEVFVQGFDAGPIATDQLASLTPAAALERTAGRRVVGNAARGLTALDATIVVEDALPDARDERLLPAALADLPPSPFDGRAPDARLPL